MSHRFSSLILALAAAAAAPAAASAASVTAVLYGTSDTPAGVSPGSHTLNVSFQGEAAAGAYVGQINWHSATSADWNAGDNAKLLSILGPNATFATYCIEGTQNVYFGSSETWTLGVLDLASTPNPGSGMGAAKAAQLTEFWDRFHDSIGTDNTNATAFQLGVWEIVNDGITADPFSTGDFLASGSTPDGDALGTAAGWLSQIGSATPYTPDYTLYTLSDGGIQDQIFAVRSTPLPAAFPAGAAALLALAASGWHRRRKPVPA